MQEKIMEVQGSIWLSIFASLQKMGNSNVLGRDDGEDKNVAPEGYL
jgi:hypothetical protein